MTMWVLIFILYPNSNASVGFTIDNVESLLECERVGKIISDWRSSVFSKNPEFKCIEVRKSK